MKYWALIFALLSLLSVACGPMGPPAVHMTPEVVSTHGSASYMGSMDDLFPVVSGVLESQNYEIALTNPEKGIILTKRKLVREETSTTESIEKEFLEEISDNPDYTDNDRTLTTTVSRIYRQYEARLSVDPNDPRQVVIELEPKIFINEEDLSRDQVWVLEGPDGEIALWNQLFQDIEKYQ